MAFFPMFIELKNASCLIVGGGKVAYRKAIVLKDFGADITIVSPIISEDIKRDRKIICLEKYFEDADLEERTLVVAATDDKELNHSIAQLCLKRKIPVNAVDQIEDCSFIFPSYVKEKNVVAAVSSGGNSPVITQYLKSRIKKMMSRKSEIWQIFLEKYV